MRSLVRWHYSQYSNFSTIRAFQPSFFKAFSSIFQIAWLRSNWKTPLLSFSNFKSTLVASSSSFNNVLRVEFYWNFPNFQCCCSLSHSLSKLKHTARTHKLEYLRREAAAFYLMRNFRDVFTRLDERARESNWKVFVVCCVPRKLIGIL